MSGPPKPASVADRFRKEIAKADADGEARKTLTLHLTHGDAAKLQRDRAIAVADISFADGQMSYLGVKVVRGAAESVLVRGDDPPRAET